MEREQAHVLAREVERAADEGIVVRAGSLPLDRAVPCIGRNSGGSEIKGTRPDRLDWIPQERRRRRRRL